MPPRPLRQVRQLLSEINANSHLHRYYYSPLQQSYIEQDEDDEDYRYKYGCDLLKVSKCLILSGSLLIMLGLTLIFNSLQLDARYALFRSFWPRNIATKMVQLPDKYAAPEMFAIGDDNFDNDAGMCLDGQLPNDNVIPRNMTYLTEVYYDQMEKNSTQSADRLVAIFVDKYFAKVQYSILRRSCYPKFLVFYCSTDLVCGGLGDRLRGVVGVFYLAVATNRILHIHWDKTPAKLDQFYKINAELYFANQQFTRVYDSALKIYARKLELSRKRYNVARVTFLDKGDEYRYVDFVKKMLAGDLASMNILFDTAEYLEFNTNSFIALNGIFQHNDTNPTPAQVQFFDDYLVGTNMMTTSDSSFRKIAVNMPLLISASVRLLFNSLQPRLSQAVASFIVQSAGNLRNWQRLTKIGLQIRAGITPYEEVHGRVENAFEQNCFVKEVEELISNLTSAENKSASNLMDNFLIFVTSDSENVTDYVINQLTESNPLRAVRTPGLAIHLDKVDSESEEAGENNAVNKPFFDFYLLTQMDRLIISRSGYGEMAAMQSLVPTFRFRKQDDQALCYFYKWGLLTLKME